MNSEQTVVKTNRKIDLSVIIVNHNTSRLLRQCLQSIYNTVPDVEMEIIVVDNASSDDSLEMIRSHFPLTKVIANSVGLGFARAANLALTQGTGSYFLLAHPDVMFASGAIQTMLSFLVSHAQVGVVGANLIYPDGRFNRCEIKRSSVRQILVEFLYATFRSLIKISPWLQDRFDRERDAFYWDHQANSESELIWNACMMFKREVLENIGSFCEEFYIWFADTDWCYRAKNAGWQMYYLFDANVIHYEKQSGNYLDHKLVRYKVRPALVQQDLNRDRYIFLKRHYNPVFLWFRKVIDAASLSITALKLVLLRVFAPSRYHSTLDLTR